MGLLTERMDLVCCVCELYAYERARERANEPNRVCVWMHV